MKRYEEWILDLIPGWMQGPWSSFWQVIGRLTDLTWEENRESGRTRFADRCPQDALEYAAREAQVPTFLGLDTVGQVRARCQGAWDWHPKTGTAQGFDDLFEILGLDPDETGVLDQSNGPHWFTETWYSAFAVVTRNPLEWGQRTETWDELEARGLTWTQLEALGEAWGYTAPAALFSQIRSFMWDEKPAHAVPAYFVCSFGDGHTWDSWLLSAATWADVEGAGTTWDDLGDAEAFVVQTARYWNALNLEAEDAPITWDQLEAQGLRWNRLMTARD